MYLLCIRSDFYFNWLILTGDWRPRELKTIAFHFILFHFLIGFCLRWTHLTAYLQFRFKLMVFIWNDVKVLLKIFCPETLTVYLWKCPVAHPLPFTFIGFSVCDSVYLFLVHLLQPKHYRIIQLALDTFKEWDGEWGSHRATINLMPDSVCYRFIFACILFTAFESEWNIFGHNILIPVALQTNMWVCVQLCLLLTRSDSSNSAATHK